MIDATDQKKKFAVVGLYIPREDIVTLQKIAKTNKRSLTSIIRSILYNATDNMSEIPSELPDPFDMTTGRPTKS